MATYIIVRKDPDSDRLICILGDGIVLYGTEGGIHADRLCRDWNEANPQSDERLNAWVLVVPGAYDWAYVK